MLNTLLTAIGRAALDRFPAFSDAPGEWHVEHHPTLVALHKSEQLVLAAKDVGALAASILDTLDGTHAKRVAEMTFDDDFTTEEAAIELGLTHHSVKCYAGRGMFPGARKVGRVWMIPPTAIVDFAHRRGKVGRPKRG